MIKKFVGKPLSVLLCAAIVLSCSVFSGSAAKPQWDEYWDDYSQKGKALYMSPGSDETSRGFSWYSPSCSGECFVEVSTSPDMSGAIKFHGEFVKAGDADRRNRVTVSGLSLGTEYYYRCGIGSVYSDTYSFRTLSSGSEDFSLFYTTDIHITESSEDEYAIRDFSYNLDTTLNAALERREDLALVLSGGDQASYGLVSEYIGLVASPVFRSIPFATTIGNHDRKAPTYKHFKHVPNEYKNYITSSYIGSDYWFVMGGVLFLMLDTNNPSAEDHRNFVKKAVAENPNVYWRVAVFHHDLYGGRIPKREQENGLLRMLLTPIMDEFKVDLALMGHSHFYTISNVMFNDKTVLPTAELDSVDNPAGTIYMVSGSINRPRIETSGEVPPLGEHVGKSYLTEEKIYNIIDFTDDSIAIHSYTLESDEEFESFTISKTSNDGGHPDSRPGFKDTIVRYISVLVGIFNNLGRTLDYLKDYLTKTFNF